MQCSERFRLGLGGNGGAICGGLFGANLGLCRGCFKVDLRAVKGLEDAAKGLCVGI